MIAHAAKLAGWNVNCAEIPYAELSFPIKATKLPVVKAGQGLTTLFNSIVANAIALFVNMAFDIVKLRPLTVHANPVTIVLSSITFPQVGTFSARL